jgi:glycosyltransferase involved in cell wall biosynthesis
VTPRLLHVTTVPMTLRFVVGHVAHARSRGFEVHVLSSPGEALDEFARDLQVEAHAVPMARRIAPRADLAALWRMVRVMRHVRPTIVDAHTPKGGLLAMMAAALCRVPVRVYHQHGLPLMTATGLKRRILRWTERIACRLAHQVICISPLLREVLIGEGLCPPGKIKVLEHGSIDGVEADGKFDPAGVSTQWAELVLSRYQIPPGAPVIGFVGRVVRDKGLIELAQAWRVLREEWPSLHLLVAGPFESEDPIPTDVEATLRGDPRIHLAGMVHDMPGIYRTLDLLVLPSYREGFNPRSGRRRWGCRWSRPDLGMRRCSPDGETGLLVPVRAPQVIDAIGGTGRPRAASTPRRQRPAPRAGRIRPEGSARPCFRVRTLAGPARMRRMVARGWAPGSGSLVWPALPFMAFVAVFPSGTLTCGWSVSPRRA